MHVLQINSFGFIRGGSDRYFIELSDVLSSNGHDVSFLTSADRRNIIDSTYAVDGFNVDAPTIMDVPKFLYSKDAKVKLTRLIEDKRPDVAHLHIYYGQITASILPVLKDRGIPIVQTLHEYKQICPVYTLVRNGRICEDCGGKSYWKAVANKCNRGSFLRSLASAAEQYLSMHLGAREAVDHFITISNFMRNKLIEHGMDGNKLTTVYNFVRSDRIQPSDEQGSYILYFGRIEVLKGIPTLLKAMKHVRGCKLLVVGTGSAKEEMEAFARQQGSTNIEFLGFKTGEELAKLVRGSICVVVPSEWYEPFGLVILEAFAYGRPVIVSDLGGMPELVENEVDGLVFEAGNVLQLADAMQWMVDHKQKALEMGKAGRKKVESEFTWQRHYEEIMSVYEKVAR